MGTIVRDERIPITSIGDNRQTLRKAVKLRARLRDRGATRFDIEVVDLSMTGFRAETAYRLPKGTMVWITLPGMSGLEAEVAWQTYSRIGCAFRQPLHPAIFEHIVELSRR